MAEDRTRITDAKAVLLSNIKALQKRMDTANEQRGICMDMLTQLLWSSAERGGGERIYAQICRAVSCGARDRAWLCEAIRSKAGDVILMDTELFEERTTGAETAIGRIAYVKNKRNDDAYLAFAKKLKGAKAEYATSFSDACEAVLNGSCEFCILPIENSREGKLYSFYAMLERYELSIVGVAEISNEDGSDSVVYALVGRNIDYAICRESGCVLEFSAVGDVGRITGNIIEAADELGGRVLWVGSQPVGYDDRIGRVYFSLSFEETSVIPMALYLSYEFSGYTPLGLYKNT